MGTIFGKEKPLKEVLRENKRMINRAIRELDREKLTLEREEKRLTVEIKREARAQQMSSVKIMARDLVRTRQYITKFIEMRSHLQGCALKLQTVKSHQAMAEAMANTAKAMHKMNKAVDVPAINKMMADFERENAKSEMMQEIMGDAIDDALAEDGTEDEEDRIVAQVLDEIGISLGDEIPDAPMVGLTSGGVVAAQESAPAQGGNKVAQATASGGGGPEQNDPALNELEARLNNLKR